MVSGMNWFRGKGVTIVWLLAFAVLVVNAALVWRNVRVLAENDAGMRQAYEVLFELEALLAALTDAETSMRGYVIAGEPDFLAPFQPAVAEIEERLRRLGELLGANSQQQRRLRAVADLGRERLAEAQRVLDLHRTQGPEAARQAVRTGPGRARMEALRDAMTVMEDVERQVLAERSASSRAGFQTVLVTELFGAAVALGMTGVAFLLVQRELTSRRRSEAALQQARDELEERVRKRTEDYQAANAALRFEVEERVRLEEQALRAAEELQRSNRELEQFAYVASHDLQEPLRKIQTFGDRLRARAAAGLDDQGKEYVERMLTSATRMRRLIDDLLSFARVATKAQRFAPVDLNALARDVVFDLEGSLQVTGGRVEVGELPTVDADPVQMRQLLQNLIANGLKFHRPEEPPVVQVAGRLLNGGAAEPRCEVTVRDNGIGFNEAYAERIFQVFQRLHGRNEYEGTGMGLAICRKIVERHGGRISASSAPGQGSTFVVTLPVHQPHREEPSP